MLEKRRIGGFALAFGTLLSSATGISEGNAGAPESEVVRIVTELPTGGPLSAEFLDKDEVHGYSVSMEGGDFLHVELEQRGIDVELALVDSRGDVLIDVDSPGGTHSTERLGFVVRETGTFEIVVRPSGPLRERRYSIRAEEPRAADDSDVRYARACEAMSEGDRLRAEDSKPSFNLALRQYLLARDAWHELGETSQEGIAWLRLAQIWNHLERIDQEEDYCLKALTVLDRTAGQGSQDVKALKVDVLLRLATVLRKTARPEEAIAANEEARCFAQAIGNRSSETHALNNLATISSQLGKYEEALNYNLRTAQVYRELEHPSLAGSLRKTGDVYIILGRPREALSAYQESLVVARDAGLPRPIDIAHIGIAWYHYTQGEYEEALESFGEVIEHTRERGDYDLLCGALDRRGSTYFMLERYEEALASYEEALEICERFELDQPLGPVLVNMGEAYIGLGRPDRALDVLRRALPVVRRMEDQATEADALLYKARAERELARWDQAIADGTAVLEVVESLRSDIRNPDDRLLFMERPRQAYYEFNVDLLMERASATGDESFAARAFAVAERNRARVLFELLGEARSDVGEGDPLDLASVQRLLDPGTVLLTYFLGEERSFLWRVGRDDFATYILPKREKIEEVALKLYSSFKRSAEVRMRGPLRLHTEKLSRMILEAVEDSLGHERLVIVADGALQYIPFAALLDPSSSEPLVVDHEIVTLPSASVLAVLREKDTRAPNLWSVAVVADPVTDRTDERLRGILGDQDGHDNGPGDYPRLGFSHTEAMQILSMYPRERTSLSEGFEANLETVRSELLRSYDIVHFSAHGALDTERPERSAIVLSLFDRNGRPRDGLLKLEEIQTLDLSAELVVLGACRTALGREVHGEGLVGLTRGFMYAGASRVMVSLWDVSDQGTSELMQRFYRALAEAGERPAAALRTVQKSMLEEPSFQSPYYWAPFVLQGDWR